MISALLVEVFCDGNAEIGYGHVRRSISLAAYLASKDIAVRITGLSIASKQMVSGLFGFDGVSNISIFDSPNAIDNEIEKASKNDNVTVTLDWFGNYLPDINIAVYPHHQVRSTRKSYMGFDYIIIRDDILSAGPQAPSKVMNNVVVCLGGGDLLGQGYETARMLSYKGYQVTLIQGPLAKLETSSHQFKVLANPMNYAEVIIKADWLVTNGGSSLFEAMYLGKPTFVLPQTDMEIIIANYAKEHQAIIGMGIESLSQLKKIEVEKICKNAKSLVDGRGLEKITAIIKSLL